MMTWIAVAVTWIALFLLLGALIYTASLGMDDSISTERQKKKEAEDAAFAAFAIACLFTVVLILGILVHGVWVWALA